MGPALARAGLDTGGSGRLIAYRGQEYYRNIVETTNYNHTMVPNTYLPDCGDTTFDNAHIAARSYHPGGVNVSFADGSR